MNTPRIALATLGAFWLAASPSGADTPDGQMVELLLGAQKVEGTPLAWNERHVQLLGRDGRLWQFAPDEVVQFRKTAPRFRSYTTSEFRALLLDELEDGFEVTGTGHYLVAHRRGQRDRWAGRFEDLYRAMVHYFSVRGFELSEPPCPLLGIVCNSREQFKRYAKVSSLPADAEVLGYYDCRSNRIVLYDAGEGDPSPLWRQNASVVIHEAAHQTAFNTGIHNRLARPPLWVAEGLATMFEAPGVHRSRHHPHQADRVHHGWLNVFRDRVAPQHRPEALAELIGSDRLFRNQPEAAYAQAWALTLYLVETQRARYSEYLALTASRSPFEPYGPAERRAEFAAVFGDDWPMLQARLLRFVDGLP